MRKKALVIIDIQNDITKHYRDIIDNINAAMDWAMDLGMTVIYIKHNNLSPGTRTFKPDTKGAELAPELKVVSDNIGAFFSMNAGFNTMIRYAYFISPVVDMEQLILNMMSWANVTEKELEKKGVIPTSFGEDLSWDYLCYVREHPASWTVSTRILYGSRDNLTSFETISAFAEAHDAELTVMEDGEHWFHTDEQMRFLDNWIINGRSIR